ncbi:hypothetical protein [Herbaspirillum sp. RV1423]|uniref:hypothetical protein n=1 Tax=Herbaspirillum sp. RV1423 TaxID=1443993 RepID=UPI0004AF6784|nr:hypothetical protein [Herbaspirillum sp. RV1423]
MKKATVLGLLALGCMLASGASSAHTRFYGGVYIGGPLWVPPPVYYPPPAYYPPPVYVERAPPVYIEQNPAPSNYWFYCQESKSYYPYVQSCPSNWMKVVPNGPNGGQPPPQ